jgi:hypothetical protein
MLVCGNTASMVGESYLVSACMSRPWIECRLLNRMLAEPDVDTQPKPVHLDAEQMVF